MSASRRPVPSVPVEVLGLNGTPEAGDVLNVVSTEAQAREIAEYRAQAAKDKRAAAGAATTLDQLLAKAKADESVAELPIVVKADVQGSAEAIIQAMEKIGNEEVRVRVLHHGVGAITESDVGLAEASGAPVIGFNVRANAPARNSANQKGVEIRYYSVIYDLVDDVKAAASGLLGAEVRENFIGYAEIKETFRVSGVGTVAGCLVTEGVARRSAGVRLLRDDVVVHEGTLKTLKRFKDEVKEVQSGQECGMAFENYERHPQGRRHRDLRTRRGRAHIGVRACIRNAKGRPVWRPFCWKAERLRAKPYSAATAGLLGVPRPDAGIQRARDRHPDQVGDEQRPGEPVQHQETHHRARDGGPEADHDERMPP